MPWHDTSWVHGCSPRIEGFQHPPKKIQGSLHDFLCKKILITFPYNNPMRSVEWVISSRSSNEFHAQTGVWTQVKAEYANHFDALTVSDLWESHDMLSSAEIHKRDSAYPLVPSIFKMSLIGKRKELMSHFSPQKWGLWWTGETPCTWTAWVHFFLQEFLPPEYSAASPRGWGGSAQLLLHFAPAIHTGAAQSGTRPWTGGWGPLS